MDQLQLEERFPNIASGSRTNLVADLVSYVPGAHVCRTAIHKQIFHCDWYIKPQKGRFTVLNAIVVKTHGKFWVQCDGKSKVIEHDQQGVVTPIQAIEVCAGIGAMGKGMQSCKVSTQCYVEYNPKFSEWLRDHGHLGVVEGNIAHTQVVIQAAEQAPHAQMLVGGVACQPFSRLGDRKEQADQRSESFPAFLRMLHWLQLPLGVMECTSEVFDSSWAQGLLNTYMDATGSCCAQKILHLHRCWPSFRTRWWAVITRQGIPAMLLDDLPDIAFTPGIVHVIPRMLDLPNDQLAELELDLYELRAFHSCKKGVQSCIVEKCRPMATATHSWGSQVVGCKCGCRKEGFSQARLDNQGLHGAVFVLPGYEILNGEEVSKLRHLHPQEVALMCGLVPSWVTPSASTPLRLELAGVGQLASPLQSGWIIAQVIAHLQQCGYIRGDIQITPKKVLCDLTQELFQERDRLWQVENPTRYMEIFQSAIVRTLSFPAIEEDNDAFQQALLTSVKRAEQGIDHHSILWSSNDEGDEDDKLDDASIQEFLRVEANQGIIGRTSSFDDVVERDPYEFVESESLEECFLVPPIHSKCGEGDASFSIAGGHPGFRIAPNKRKHEDEHESRMHEKKPKVNPFSEVGDQDISDPIVAIAPVESPDNQVDFIRLLDENPGTFHDDSYGDVSQGFHIIQILREGLNHPTFVRVPALTRVQQILDAEGQLCDDADSIVARDCIGQIIPPDRTVQAFQRIHVEHEDDFVRSRDLQRLQCDSRYAILTKQGSWVANDEMDFYLKSLQEYHQIECVPVLHHPVMHDQVLEDWTIQMIKTDNPSNVVCTAVCMNQHWFPIAAMHRTQHVQIFTNQDGFEWVSKVFSEFQGLEIRVCDCTREFSDDCGFQTIGWLAHLLAACGTKDTPTGTECWSITSSQAEVLRSMFEHHLHVSGRAKLNVHPCCMQFGGAINGLPEDQLRKLLEEHGVPKDKLQARVNMIMEKLGRQSVIQCCRAPRPWQELKAVANSQTPKIQLILPSELAEKIRERVASGESFGDRKQKKPENRKEQPFPRLQPDDLTIPLCLSRAERSRFNS